MVASVVAADAPRFDELKLEASRVSLSAKYAALDSDGDGWADWYERFEGTDPFDAGSHPGAATLELVDGRVVVQSIAFPDRLAIVDLQSKGGLKTAESSISELLALVQGQQTGTAVGAMRDEMIAGLLKLGGSDTVTEILAQAEKEMGGGEGFEPRVGGVSVGLISDVTVSTNSGGGTRVKVTDGSDSKQYDYWPKSGDVTGYSVEHFSSPSGGSASIETYTRNGRTTGSTLRIYDRAGNLVSTQFYDGDGKPKGPPIPAGGSTGSSAPGSSEPATTAAQGSGSSAPATTAPASSTPASQTPTSGDYVNPDADTTRPPSLKEVKARIEFLSGLIARFGNTLDLPAKLTDDKPGVADPAEPECRDDRCVVFTVVEAPDLHRTAGGDPVNPDWAPDAPPHTMP